MAPWSRSRCSHRDRAFDQPDIRGSCIAQRVLGLDEFCRHEFACWYRPLPGWGNRWYEPRPCHGDVQDIGNSLLRGSCDKGPRKQFGGWGLQWPTHLRSQRTFREVTDISKFDTHDGLHARPDLLPDPAIRTRGMRTALVLHELRNRTALGSDGGSAVPTPAFDRFAERTVAVDRHYVGSLPCTPARRDLQTAWLIFMHRSWGPSEPLDISFARALSANGTYTHIMLVQKTTVWATRKQAPARPGEVGCAIAADNPFRWIHTRGQVPKDLA